MYKVASDRRQTALHRGRPADWANGREAAPTTDRDRFERLQEEVRVISARLAACHGHGRSQLVAQKLEVEAKLGALKKKLKAETIRGTTLHTAFFDVAQQMLPKLQFEMIKNAAVIELERRRRTLADDQ